MSEQSHIPKLLVAGAAAGMGLHMLYSLVTGKELCGSKRKPKQFGSTLTADNSVEFKGYAAFECCRDVQLQPWSYHPRPIGPDDVEIDIRYAGICHSDIHFVTGGWGGSKVLPVIPGHEIAGFVTAVGSNVKDIKIGQPVGVGAQALSCLQQTCKSCKSGKEQCCPDAVYTYGGKYGDGQVSQGGYANRVRVHQHFTFVIPNEISLQSAAPLFCAGATVFNPLKRFKVGPGMRVAVVGIGGLGHLGIQFASKMGAIVTAVSSGSAKREIAKELGAHHYIDTSNKAEVAAAKRSFDFVLLTANFGNKDHLKEYMNLCDVNGTLCTVAAPEEPFEVDVFTLLSTEVNFCGSAIGSRSDITEMLQFCAKHGVKPWVEVLPLSQCNEGMKKVQKNQVRFRVVLDTSK